MGGCGDTDQPKPLPQRPLLTNPPPPAQDGRKTDVINIHGGDIEDCDVKILTLGAGECGKSTIWRQLKLIYCGGIGQDERDSMKQVIKINVISDIKTLVDALKRSGQSIATELSNAVDLVSDLQLSEEELLPEVAQEIARLWNDPVMKVAYEQANSIGLGDHASFFFDSIGRIADPSYVPTEEDILKSRIRTTGVASLNFYIDDVKTELVDVGGQKNERGRWQKCFQNVNYLIFVISLSDFDQRMFEDEAMSRTKDSLELFGSTANSPTFERKKIFLVLNKVDIFKRKLAQLPERFRNAYPDFQGDVNNVEQAIDHVRQSFIAKLDPARPAEATVEAIPCCAMDPQSIRDLFQKIGRQVLDDRS